MDAEHLLRYFLDELGSVEKFDCLPLMAEYLIENDYFVAEDEDELADLALENTDLVEPQ